VLEHPERYVRALQDPDLLERHSWQRQGEILLEVYAALLEKG
jgi:hypothetical protein